DVGSPLTTPRGTKDLTWNQPGTPYGIGNGFDGVPDFTYVQTSFPQSGFGRQYNYRVDYQVTQKDLAAFSLFWTPRDDKGVNGPARLVNSWDTHAVMRSWTGLYTHTFSGTMVNEGRVGFSGWYFNEMLTNPQEPFGLPISNIDGNGGVPGDQQLGPNGPGVFDQ